MLSAGLLACGDPNGPLLACGDPQYEGLDTIFGGSFDPKF